MVRGLTISLLCAFYDDDDNYAADPDATLTLSPSPLGVYDVQLPQNGPTVNITWAKVDHPKRNNMVGVYCPAACATNSSLNCFIKQATQVSNAAEESYQQGSGKYNLHLNSPSTQCGLKSLGASSYFAVGGTELPIIRDLRVYT